MPLTGDRTGRSGSMATSAAVRESVGRSLVSIVNGAAAASRGSLLLGAVVGRFVKPDRLHPIRGVGEGDPPDGSEGYEWLFDNDPGGVLHWRTSDWIPGSQRCHDVGRHKWLCVGFGCRRSSRDDRGDVRQRLVVRGSSRNAGRDDNHSNGGEDELTHH